MQLVPKKADHSNPSNYRPIALISCLAKVFEYILNEKILKHLSLHNLLSDRQYGFRQGRSTGDLLAFLTVSWSSSFRDFGETFAVALDISKALDRVWHKALISKLPSYSPLRSIHSYADDTTLHFSTSFQRRPTLQEVHSSRRVASERLTSDLSKILIGAEQT